MTTSALPVDAQWYKHAIIYQAHVRAFFDGNGDGVGDFAGLTEKLDYIARLGVSAVWLLPFYPSPLRDDGYDIAHYEGVHPSYGTLRDFRRFLREAHDRQLRVITELVINHTSDQHPWFQAARRAPRGSRKRDYYVWHDTPDRYPGVPIVFKDTEPSNWTWDALAGAFYWHRFFAHQPDLNFDNPRVIRAVLKVMAFWLEMGVDGMRLDAVPYLVERDGTMCENLPETHAILKRIRREMETRYPGRMLLAEANQWPADVRPYFGDGDESHMAFHFPLMPRLFMAVRQENRYPILDVLRQTPDIPESCQWATFLRNHDELTLEMVTREERDYMWAQYAADPQMRINMGIRRRLAPLVENHRGRIELLNGLLFSLPGTPVLYYGDEIGMGDNVYLGDRNTVRTPMQWSGDRNGGFSRADPARLYLPPVMDAVYGYQTVNVEAQDRSPFSLLNWMRRLIAVRQQRRTFGHGTIEFLEPDNTRILAFVREHEDERILVVANLARSAQPVSLDLSRYDGLLPIEMLDRTEFPRIGRAPYLLSLGPYAFFWFELVDPAALPSAGRATPPPPASQRPLPGLMVGPDWDRLLDSEMRTTVERQYLRPFLARQPWFTREIAGVASQAFDDWLVLARGQEPLALASITVRYVGGEESRHLLPLALVGGAHAAALAAIQPDRLLAEITGARDGVMADATPAPLAAALFRASASGQASITARGAFTAEILRPEAQADLAALLDTADRFVERTPAHHTVVTLGDAFVLKLLRTLEPDPHPEIELPRELEAARRRGTAGVPRSPRTIARLTHRLGGREPAVAAIVQEFLPHQRSAWDQAIEAVSQTLDHVVSLGMPAVPQNGDAAATGAVAASRAVIADDVRSGGPLSVPDIVRDTAGGFLATTEVIGARLAGMHAAFAESGASGFGVGRDGAAYFADVERSALDAWEAVLPLLARRDGELAPRATAIAARLLADAAAGRARLASLAALARASRPTIRVHGDLNLTEILLHEADAHVIDFEGDPQRPIGWRRRRHSPLRDLATLALSLRQAAHAGLSAYASTRPTDFDRLEPWIHAWRVWSARALVAGYAAGLSGTDIAPPWTEPSTAAALDVLVAEQALQDLVLALRYRADRVWVPLATLGDLLLR